MGEKELHINNLEMKVIQHPLNAFLLRIVGKSVMLLSDNATMVAYLKKHGDTVSRVTYSVAQEIVEWLRLPMVVLLVTYLPRKKS